MTPSHRTREPSCDVGPLLRAAKHHGAGASKKATAGAAGDGRSGSLRGYWIEATAASRIGGISPLAA
jgi:hypothetical protein